MMQWGYGLICLGGFVFMVGFIVFVMYLYRAIRLNGILNGQDFLAHWIYDSSEYSRQTRKIFENTKKENLQKISIVWFFFVIFTIPALIFGFSSTENEERLQFLSIIICCVLIISFFAFVMPYVFYRQSLKANPEVYISKKGLFFAGQLHTWGGPLFRLRDVFISKNGKNLVFKIDYLTRLGWIRYDTYNVEVPIPKGDEKNAEIIVHELGGI